MSFIPKEQLAAYQHWQLADFDGNRRPAANSAANSASHSTPMAPATEPPPPPPMPDLVSLPQQSMPPLPTAEEIERIHEEARQAGFAEGREAGLAEGRAEMQQQAERLAELTTALQHSLTQVDQDIAEDLLALALQVAQQVLQTALKAQPELLLPVVREALAMLPLHHGNVSLHLNPEDAPLVREHLGDQFSHSGWRIVEDRQVQSGGCKLHTHTAEIDASLATRWQRVLESIGVDGDWLNRQP